MRARVYDDEVRRWISEVGIEGIGKKLVNSKEGPPTLEKPAMTIEKLLEYGNMLVQEQENVKRVQLADKYLSEAALGDANKDAISTGNFYGEFFLHPLTGHIIRAGPGLTWPRPARAQPMCTLHWTVFIGLRVGFREYNFEKPTS